MTGAYLLAFTAVYLLTLLIPFHDHMPFLVSGLAGDLFSFLFLAPLAILFYGKLLSRSGVESGHALLLRRALLFLAGMFLIKVIFWLGDGLLSVLVPYPEDMADDAAFERYDAVMRTSRYVLQALCCLCFSRVALFFPALAQGGKRPLVRAWKRGRGQTLGLYLGLAVLVVPLETVSYVLFDLYWESLFRWTEYFFRISEDTFYLRMNAAGAFMSALMFILLAGGLCAAYAAVEQQKDDA
ncbi:hypothetical protein [Salidesulfovibrio onnuriiensis]|uniref:hypothetical protein n=1 Tax=Salidesulfovibrio onnuriiensis TaxID=2583823 RepID=UPI0011CBD44B|nr:hypothetical protein [Salidesulfovibrio onnuriiensis]